MKTNISKTIINLKKNNIQAYFTSGRDELLNLLNDLIPENSSVGCGDSVTMEQLAVFDYFRKRGDLIFYNKHREGLTREQKREMYLKKLQGGCFCQRDKRCHCERRNHQYRRQWQQSCSDNLWKDRICNAFVMIASQFDANRMHVILVDGNYGY